MDKWLKKMLGMCVVFDKDGEAGDANNSNASGGKDDDKGGAGGAGGGAAGDDKGGDKKPSAEDLKTKVTVDGEEKLLSAEELVKYAQLGFSSTQRYEDASKISKAGEKGVRIQELMTSIDAADEPNQKEVAELAGLFGADPATLMSDLGGKTEQKIEKKVDEKGGGVTKEQIAEALGVDVDELKATLAHSKNRHIESARKELREFSDQAVDKDEILGKMIGSGEQKDNRLSVIKDMINEDVFRKINLGETYGAEMVAASIQKVRAQLTKFGIPNKPDLAPIVMGQGPGGVLPAEVQAEEPIKRVGIFDEGGENNAINRYYQKALKAKRNLLNG